MSMFGKNTAAKSTIDSLIGSSTRIEGDVHFQGGLRIDGHVKGNVNSRDDEAGMLVISEQASVEGQIRVTHLVVNGTITGPIFVSELLELQPKARITGNISYKALEMHNGAVVEGTLSHSDGEYRPGLKLAATGSVRAGSSEG